MKQIKFDKNISTLYKPNPNWIVVEVLTPKRRNGIDLESTQTSILFTVVVSADEKSPYQVGDLVLFNQHLRAYDLWHLALKAGKFYQVSAIDILGKINQEQFDTFEFDYEEDEEIAEAS
jgi:hypothetical protein